MLESTTWSEYLTAISVALVLYYVLIGVKYFKNEISVLVFTKKIQQQTTSSSNAITPTTDSSDSLLTYLQNPPNDINANEIELGEEVALTSLSNNCSQPELFTPNKYYSSIPEPDNTLEKVQGLTARLKEVVAEAYHKNLIKEEFFTSLQLLFKNYPFLKGSPYLVSLNNLIASECEKYGYIHLSAEERVMLWNE